MYSLKNKTAIITGGGSGIGKSISLLFAQQGAHVYILDLDEKGSVEVVEQIRNKGGSADYFVCPVNQEEDVKKTVDAIVRKRIPDILVNNAGIAHIGNVETTDPADFEKLFSVNVKGVYHLCKVVFRI